METTVQQIHDEFLTASHTLVQEAQKLLDGEAGKELGRGQRLARLGFDSAKQVVESREANGKISNLPTVLRWKARFPANPFITEERVMQICKKYGLLLGNASSFAGYVPEKNIGEIEAFRSAFQTRESAGVPWWNFWRKDYQTRRYYRRLGKYGVWREITETEYSSQSVSRTWLEDWFYKMDGIPLMKIVAPQKDFTISARERVEDNKIVPVPDPVVLQPVNGGYLVVTAWGPEADEVK